MNHAQKRRKICGRLVAAVLLAATLLFTASTLLVEATESALPRTATELNIPATLSPIPTRSTTSYTSYPITVWGTALGARALAVRDTLYVPLRAFAAATGAGVSYSSTTRTLTVRHTGLHITVSDGSYVTYVNDRPFFNGKNAAIMSDGRMYVPIDTAMKAFGLTYSRGRDGTVIISGRYTPAKHASEFYRQDEVLWLSRIISAESRGEPLLGQIAVGSVVMNRVKSKYYPNTIYGVIFDRKYGVQFSPILDGSIYNTPTYNCTLAAKICLEGVRVGTGAMFFLRPEASESLWIPAQRRFLFSIGNHDFYA